jgi:transposase
MPRGHILDLRWNTLLNDFRRSGLTHAEFCHRRGISIHSFRKRLYQAPTPKPIPANPPSSDAAARHFLPVTILPDPIPAEPAASNPLELILPNGRRIAVAPGFDPHTLRRLIATVEERPCSE